MTSTTTQVNGHFNRRLVSQKYIDMSGSKLVDTISPNHEVYSMTLNFDKIFGDLELFEQIIYDRHRPIDKVRCRKMAESIDTKDTHHWGDIYVGFVPGSNPKLLDGQHRIQSCTYMKPGVYHSMRLHMVGFRCDHGMFDYFSDLQRNDLIKLYRKSLGLPF